jgi:hypothetical protein
MSEHQNTEVGESAPLQSLFVHLTGWFDLPLNGGERHEFVFSDPYEVSFSLIGRSEGAARPDLTCRYELTARRPITPEMFGLLKTLASGRLPLGSGDPTARVQLDDGVTFFPLVAADGSFDATKPAELRLLPKAVADIFFGTTRVDFAHVRRVAQLIQWRHGWSSGRLRSHSDSAEWSLDEVLWRPWPSTMHVRVSGGSAFRIDEPSKEWVQRLAEGKMGEPVAHELLREANDV